MQYEIDMTCRKTVKVDAESRQEAISKAKAAQVDSFRPLSVTEMVDDDTEGPTFLYMGSCETCETPLFENDKYSRDEDCDCLVCEACTERGGLPAVTGA